MRRAWRLGWLALGGGGLALSLGACTTARGGGGPAYPPAAIPAILQTPERYAGRRVLVAGQVADLAPGEVFARGTLTDAGVPLAFEGEWLDWRAAPGDRAELWGVIRRRPGGPVLELHNGRLAGDTRRQPHPTPAFGAGDAVDLVGRLRQVGPAPFAHWVVTTEDRVTLTLTGLAPPAVGLSPGEIVRVTGTVQSGPGPGRPLTLDVATMRRLTPP